MPSRALGVLIFALAVVFGAAAPADDETDARARLEAVQREIRVLRDRLAETEGRAGELQARLAESEREAGRIARTLHETQAKLADRRARLDALKQKRTGLQAELDVQRAALGEQVRTAYRLGRQAWLKLLLNQQDPAAVGRMLTYYDYFSRTRAERIEGFNETLAGLETLETELAEETQALTRLREELQQEQIQLETARDERSRVLAALQQEIGATGQTLAGLREDEQQLQALIESIREALTDIPDDLGAGAAFAERKGELPWPTEGSLVGLFGEARSEVSDAVWQGLFIESTPGGAVRAVSGGRVAFADWMRGFGLLMIIDHGQGYMSLYGHNQSLYKSPGEWVQGGELIARVGDSGGMITSGLYFEIRHEGQPLDPADWLADRETAARAD